MKTDTSINCEVNILSNLWSLQEEDITQVMRAVELALFCNKENYNGLKLAAAVVLADDQFVQNHNYKFRGKNHPTNVLAFPQIQIGHRVQSDFLTGEPIEIGDIMLAYETVDQEARNAGISRNQHLLHLVVHGALHLLGHDHQNEFDSKLMHNMEVEVLEMFGYPDPYINEN
tara:strand:+ start:240 stop:755 length:516 start_codon:yes stop_codon:yes gene_type:complete